MGIYDRFFMTVNLEHQESGEELALRLDTCAPRLSLGDRSMADSFYMLAKKWVCTKLPQTNMCSRQGVSRVTVSTGAMNGR
jgi:hypothetical protein